LLPFVGLLVVCRKQEGRRRNNPRERRSGSIYKGVWRLLKCGHPIKAKKACVPIAASPKPNPRLGKKPDAEIKAASGGENARFAF